mgnify:CR=1 FL=1
MLAAKQITNLASHRAPCCASAKTQTRAYGASGKRIPVQTKDFFEASPKLIEKRTADSRLHYIFLEGLAGAGKGSLLERLQKVRRTARLR